jgi:hypothetical protein
MKYTAYDNLINTGIWKDMLFEVLYNALAPYPFLDGILYTEYVKDYDIWIEYEINDMLLVIQFGRIYLVMKFILFLT